MNVRCGRCQTAFEVAGPGRYPCPACGTPNDVRESATEPEDGLLTPPPPPGPEPPSPRAQCVQCGFTFIVGDVSEVPCPNCGMPVTVLAPEGDA